MLEFLLGGGVVLLGVIGGAAIVNVTNVVERRHEREDTPMEKANRAAYRRPMGPDGEPISEDAPVPVTTGPTRGILPPSPTPTKPWNSR